MTMNVPLGSGIGDFPLDSSIGNVPEGLQVSSDSEVEGDSNIPGPSDRKRRRGKVQAFSSKLVAALDACKISDRDAVRIIMATAESLGHNTNELIINRTSLRRFRHNFRADHAKHLREMFGEINLRGITVHWDGAMLPTLDKKTVERLPVVISCNGVRKLLGIPAIPSSSGSDQALAIFATLEEWNLTDHVEALCCDTTSSNTGRLQGACVLLEQRIERDLLYFPCRHHIYEIVLRGVFELKMPKTTGPNIQLFKKFQNSWPEINKNNYIPGTHDDYVLKHINDIQKKIEIFKNYTKMSHPRDDYKELLELAIIFLGGIPLGGISFKMPGAFHHARWMAKIIYTLKIFIFRNEFPLNQEEYSSIRDTCVFLINIYIEPWILTPMAAMAPRVDLEFIKNIIHYKNVNEEISDVALKKIVNHLWYLSPENAALSFFDKKVSVETKRSMVQALQNVNNNNNYKRYMTTTIEIKNLANLEIQHFVSSESNNFFKRFNINSDFLLIDPALWETNNNYIEAIGIITKLEVVNDVAERAVKLMKDYNLTLCKNEEEKQFILQIVTVYREKYPKIDKTTLSTDF